MNSYQTKIKQQKIKYEALERRVVKALNEGQTETEDGEDLRECLAHAQGVLWGLNIAGGKND